MCPWWRPQVWSAVEEVRPLFADIDRMVYANSKRLQAAMRRQRIGPHHFAGSTGAGGRGGDECVVANNGVHGSAGDDHLHRPGAIPLLPPSPTAVPPRPALATAGYGHGDLGRAALDSVVAEVMGAEAAAVRIQYVSGTHAISSALFGCLRCGRGGRGGPRGAGGSWGGGGLREGGVMKQCQATGSEPPPRRVLLRRCLPARLHICQPPPTGPGMSCWRWWAARMTLWRR